MRLATALLRWFLDWCVSQDLITQTSPVDVRRALLRLRVCLCNEEHDAQPTAERGHDPA